MPDLPRFVVFGISLKLLASTRKIALVDALFCSVSLFVRVRSS